MYFEFKHNLIATIVMVLSFMYGGVSLLFFILQINSIGAIPDLNYQFIEQKFVNNELPREYVRANNEYALNESPRRMFHPPERMEKRAKDFFYTLIFISLIGSIVSILAGLSILSILRKQERNKITKNMINTLTTPEEKLAIEELEINGGELTQSDLVKYTKLSKVKIHRVVKRLEGLGVIRKYPYGMTNKLKLELKKNI